MPAAANKQFKFVWQNRIDRISTTNEKFDFELEFGDGQSVSEFIPQKTWHDDFAPCNEKDFLISELPIYNGALDFYDAKHTSSQRKVLLKMIPWGKRCFQPNLVRMEETVHLKLDHPMVVKYFFTLFCDHKIYFVLEHPIGRTVQNVVELENSFSEERVAKIMWKVLEFVRFSYQQRIVIEGLSAENIYLDDLDNVKVANLEAARYEHMLGPQELEYFTQNIARNNWLAHLLYFMFTGRRQHDEPTKDGDSHLDSIKKIGDGFCGTKNSYVNELLGLLTNPDTMERNRFIYTADVDELKSLQIFSAIEE